MHFELTLLNSSLTNNTTKQIVPKAGGVPVATLGLLRGVRAGWIGRMPDNGCDCGWPALGRCRGAIEVSVVGTGSVSLGEKMKKRGNVVRKCLIPYPFSQLHGVDLNTL